MTATTQPDIQSGQSGTVTDWLIEGIVPERGLVLARDYGAKGAVFHLRHRLTLAGYESAICAPTYLTHETLAVALLAADMMPVFVVAAPYWDEATIASVAKFAVVTLECYGDAFSINGKPMDIPVVRKGG